MRLEAKGSGGMDGHEETVRCTNGSLLRYHQVEEEKDVKDERVSSTDLSLNYK